MMVYDHLLTLSAEIQYIWKQEFSGRTVIFFVNHYFCPAMVLLSLADILVDDKKVRMLYAYLSLQDVDFNLLVVRTNTT